MKLLAFTFGEAHTSTLYQPGLNTRNTVVLTIWNVLVSNENELFGAETMANKGITLLNPGMLIVLGS